MPFLDTSVKWMHEGFRGAPVLNGTAGSLLAVLRAFLITGYGLTVANSVTVSGGIATARLTIAGGFEKYAVVAVDGHAELNGESRISAVNGMDVSWPTTASDGTKSGAITLKYAPVGGWQEVYTGTNVAVFRSTDIRASGMYLRVDDTGTTVARVVGYEAMSDVNAGTNAFPTEAQLAGGGVWGKSSLANATDIPYVLAGDALFFHFGIAMGVASSATARSHAARGFGDPLSLSPTGDPYGCALSVSATTLTSPGQSAQMAGSFSGGVTGNNIYAPRARSGVAGAVVSDTFTFGATSSAVISGVDNTLGPLSASPGGRLVLSERHTKEGTTTSSPIRARIPGLLFSMQSGVLALIPDRSVVADGETRLLAVGTGNSPNTHTGVYFLDIVGPWR